jgi:RNA polymerase-binding transcription factor DksA
MTNRIKFPAVVLKPIKKFLHLKEKQLEQRRESLEKADPFANEDRLRDNASSDADASEQFGHATTEALKREVERKLIQVRKALTFIRIGKYGICEKCRKMIDTDRLMVLPETTVCAQCNNKKKE